MYTYHNRNVVMSNTLTSNTQQYKITITQRILERGHTHMEVDSVHAVIERKIKHLIYMCQQIM